MVHFQLVTEWTERSCREAALYYGITGLPVFPLEGKRPLTKRGLYEATTNTDIIRYWWNLWPEANIGIPTGKLTNWWVLDVDTRHGGFESLARLQETCREHHFEPLSLTRTAITGGGGLHLIFAQRSDLDFTPKNIVGLRGYEGLDFKASGGYIVVAPSKHESGGIYQWSNDVDPVPLPDFLVQVIRPRRKTFVYDQQSGLVPRTGGGRRSNYDPTNPDYWLEKALEKAAEGSRHRYALFLACRLVQDVGLTGVQAESYMIDYARRVSAGSHPFDEAEALGCLEWAIDAV